MKDRLLFIITGLILIAGLVLGSFFDIRISEAIFSNRNALGITFSMIGMIPGYAFLSLFGGVFLCLVLKLNYKKVWKIILVILSLISVGCSIYFTGNEFFSYNGLNMPGFGYTALAIGISTLIQGPLYYLGYRLGKNIKGEKAWIGVLIILVAVVIALVPGVTLLKSIFHRPRYRIIQEGIEGINFHNWWEPFHDYKNYLSDVAIKEEFKSFPSGHSACSFITAILMYYLPLIVPKCKKFKTPLFFIGFAYALFIGFTRMLLGAHFLSDVCFGMLISLICCFVSDEIVKKTKLFDLNNF